MPYVRAVAWSIFSTLALMAVGGLVSANVRAWAQQRGWDQWLLKISQYTPSLLQKMIAGWEPLKRRWWLWLGMGLSGGIAIAFSILSQPQPAPIPPTAEPPSPPTRSLEPAVPTQPVPPTAIVPPNYEPPTNGAERHISTTQTKTFQNAVGAAMQILPADTDISVDVIPEGGCTECVDYMYSFMPMIKNTPHIRFLGSNGVIMGPSIRNTGVNIRIFNDPAPGVDAIVAALTAAGIAFDLKREPRPPNPNIARTWAEIEIDIVHPAPH